ERRDPGHLSVRSERHAPDHVGRVIREEKVPLVFRGIGGRGEERSADGGMSVGPPIGMHPEGHGLAGQIAAGLEPVLVLLLDGRTFEAGPAEILALAGVYLLHVVPAHVADIDFPRNRLDAEPVRIAQTVGIDLAPDGLRPVVERVVAGRGSIFVYAQDFPLIAVQILGAQSVGIDRAVVSPVADAYQKLAVLSEAYGADAVGVAFGSDAIRPGCVI